MSNFIRGDAVTLGLAREDTRGTFQDPILWVPTRSPAGLEPQVEKTLIEETRHSAVQSQGSEITQRRAEGDIEFNVRNRSIGYFLENVLGNRTSSSQGDDTYQHVFTYRTEDPQYPTLSMAISQEGQQDYGFPGYQGNELSFTVETDDLVHATLSGSSRDFSEKDDFTVSFTDDDHYFRHQDVELEIADTVNDSWSSLGVRSLEFSINNNSSPRQDITSLTAKEIPAGLLEITGSLTIDQLDKDYQTIFTEGSRRALRIKMTRSNIDIGSGSEKPYIEILFPFITFEGFSNDRSRDEVVSNSIDFTAHYDESEAKAIQATIINEDSNLGS